MHKLTVIKIIKPLSKKLNIYFELKLNFQNKII